MPPQTIDLIGITKEFMAVNSTSGSALRNQEPGVVKTIQRRLGELSLGEIPTDSAEQYERWLDRTTDRVLRGVRARIRPWGTVRKATNLFLRACICDHYLRSEYGLARIEPWAEMPLDSIVAGALKRAAGRGRLPGWPGLKHLDCRTNREFQAFAERHARELGVPARIYLDYHLWLRNRSPLSERKS